MKIDLHNFFKYYDETNPKHRNAIEQLEIDLCKSAPLLMEDTANWVRIYRTPLKPPKAIILNVPFYPQTDNYRDSNRTCNASACAMCLEYFKPGTLIGPQGDDEYVRKIFDHGDTTDHSVQTKVLNLYGVKSKFCYDLGFNDLDNELTNERPVIIGILHRGTIELPTGGHVVVVIGKTSFGDYIVNDPYGSLNDNYTSSSSNGRGVIYKRSELVSRWTVEGPKTGWGRIFQVNSEKKNSKLNKKNDLPIKGIELIKEFEGCHLKAYSDPLSGNLPITIGWGSAKDLNGNPFKLGDVISQETADELLIQQIKTEFLPSLTKIPYWNQMNMNQKGALLSFSYNLGANFYNSSGFNTITRVLKNKEWNEVPSSLYLYLNPGTNVEAGLARRRKA